MERPALVLQGLEPDEIPVLQTIMKHEIQSGSHAIRAMQAVITNVDELLEGTHRAPWEAFSNAGKNGDQFRKGRQNPQNWYLQHQEFPDTTGMTGTGIVVYGCEIFAYIGSTVSEADANVMAAGRSFIPAMRDTAREMLLRCVTCICGHGNPIEDLDHDNDNQCQVSELNPLGHCPCKKAEWIVKFGRGLVFEHMAEIYLNAMAELYMPVPTE